MKYLRLFESEYFIYEDDYLRIQQIKNGPNKGKTIFSFYYKNPRNGIPSWSKYSPLAACVRMIDTKYEKMSEIRNIDLMNTNISREVKESTMDAVFRNYLSKLGFRDREDLFKADNYLRDLRKNFGSNIQEFVNKAECVGDLMDGIKEVWEYIEPYLDTKKYNL